MVLRRIVVLGKHTDIQQLGRRIAQEVLVADDLHEAVDIVSTSYPDLILLDGRLHSDDVRAFLETTDKNPSLPVIIAGSDGCNVGWGLPHQIPSAGQAPPYSSIHFLPDPNDTGRLEQIINSIQGKKSLTPFLPSDESRLTNHDFFTDDLSACASIVGKSRAILQTMKMIKLVAASNCNPVLITGETGTGKELAAKAVHISRHPNEKFVAINCAALTASLLESELFGHVKGAFTSADKDKTGLLEIADKGTIFLDEISEMPLDLQAKLLRVLQEKTFRKVGGTGDLTCKATIITSSNRDLRREVRANRFRQDLYYRLNICPIIIAPLRDPNRKSDIRLLADYFLKTSTVYPAKTGKITALTEMALEAIEKHAWPGNVRELRNVIERAILLETTDKIGLSNIIIDPVESDFTPECNAGTSNQVDLMLNSNALQNFSLDKAERELIARALQESGWQKTKAAALLGITRATLYAKVKQHNIQKGTYLPKVPQDNLSWETEPETVTTA